MGGSHELYGDEKLFGLSHLVNYLTRAFNSQKKIVILVNKCLSTSYCLPFIFLPISSSCKISHVLHRQTTISTILGHLLQFNIYGGSQTRA